MAYTRFDYPTKKSLKEAMASGEIVHCFQAGPFGPDVKDGSVCLEGPHYPKPHTWYATAQVKDNVVLSVK